MFNRKVLFIALMAVVLLFTSFMDGSASTDRTLKHRRRASVENLASQVAMMNLRLDPALYEASLTKLVNQVASIGAGKDDPCQCQMSFTMRKKGRKASVGSDFGQIALRGDKTGRHGRKG